MFMVEIWLVKVTVTNPAGRPGSIFVMLSSDLIMCASGTDISIDRLPRQVNFLKKGLSGKYILVCTCHDGQAVFWARAYLIWKMAQIPK